MDGAIVQDKPAGITSHDAVVAARRLLSEPRIGHLGTLDRPITDVPHSISKNAERQITNLK